MPRTVRAPHRKKIKKSSFAASALALLFAGLWVGTLAATNNSFSMWLNATIPGLIPQSTLTQSDTLPSVFEDNGKTYVAFDHPLLHLTVITDTSCTESICDYEKTLNSIYKELTPGIALTTMDIGTDEGKAFLTKYQVGGVPAFFFDKNITTIPVYSKIADFMTPLNDDLYLLMTPFGKYYTTPEAGLAESTGASAVDAKTTIIAYESFSCKQCKNMVPVLKDALAAHQDLRLVFKNYDRGSTDSLLAQGALCAGDQGKFWEMEEALFSGDTPPADATALETLAQTLALDAGSFKTCVESEKYKERVAADTFEAKRFGVMGTPTFFINGVPYAGEISAAQFEELIAPTIAATPVQ